MLADGILIRIERWRLHGGTRPYPRGCRINVCLFGVLLVVCDELGISLLIGRFSVVVSRSIRTMLAGNLNVLEATLCVSSPRVVPAFIIVDVGAERFSIQVSM